MRYLRFLGGMSACLALLGLGTNALARPAATAEDLEFFESKVRPILSQHCYGCHGAEKQRGGLRLDHIQTILEGGESGPALIAGNTAESRISIAISYEQVDFEMPPKGRLPEEARKTLNEWITRGAPWPEEPLPENKGAVEAFDLKKRRAEHWAWQPIDTPTPPTVTDPRFQNHPVDQFLEAPREAKGLETAPPTDRRTLARRAHFALTGLPPTPEAVEAFVNDTRPDAYVRLLDGLLSDSAFGERWGRHWFDLVRYADTHGHEGDYPIQHAWTYRDYVIRALNNDVPYNQFIREHIAGDLLESPRQHPEEGYNESILATGFWFMHQATHAPVDVKKDQADRIDNQLDVMSKAFLGMTVSCARCHDHKFDAISAKDYTAMAGHLLGARQAVAYLDPGKKIHSAALTHRVNLRNQEARIRAHILADQPMDSLSVAPYLEGAAKVLFDAPKPSDGVDTPAAKKERDPKAKKIVGRPVEKVAEELGLDVDRLARWRTALAEPGVNAPGHPLYLWRSLSEAVREMPTRKFLDHAKRLGAAATEASSGEPEGNPRVYADFDADDFASWFPSGDAFGQGPTTKESWYAHRGELAPTPADVAHSGLVSDRLQGVLRSPTFTIDSEYMHFRVAARDARIRLVIDGYQLTPFNGILFGNTMINTGDTQGAYTWFSMGNQVGKYRGERAYIELMDEGDGYIAVDQVVMSDHPRPPQEDGVLAENLVRDEITIKTLLMDDLALRYEEAFRSAWRDHHDSTDALTRDPLSALLLRRGLWWTDAQRAERDSLRDALRGSQERIPHPLRALVAMAGTPEDAEYFIRGDHRNADGHVPRGFLTALSDEGLSQAADRLSLAEKMVAPANPLTTRVYVNRIWHHLFGTGLVPSVDNFGALGQEPSHPELLDYLATQFAEQGWSTKELIKSLMLTETYQMSSVPTSAETERLDPANILLHRMSVRRLEGEAIRDSLLALGGNLNATMYGPPVPAFIPPFERNRRSPSTSGPMDGDRRRTVYLEVRRNHLLPMATAFDMPIPDTTVGARTVSNLPAQALIMMNDEFVVDQAQVWGERVLQETPDNFEGLITMLYEQALSRAPRAVEQATLAEFVTAQAALYGVPEEGAWKDRRILADLCHTVFMLKEFIYIG